MLEDVDHYLMANYVEKGEYIITFNIMYLTKMKEQAYTISPKIGKLVKLRIFKVFKYLITGYDLLEELILAVFLKTCYVVPIDCRKPYIVVPLTYPFCSIRSRDNL